MADFDANSALRVDRAAKVLYETYRSDGYAPQWGATTPNRRQWRKAAAALLEGIANGSV